VATAPVVIATLDEGGFDLAILDGEATPTGASGWLSSSRTKSRHARRFWCSRGAPDDAWLASWSRAEAAVPHPIGPRFRG